MASARIWVKRRISVGHLNFKQAQMHKLGTVGVASVLNRVRAALGPDDAAAKPLTKRYAIQKSRLRLGTRDGTPLPGLLVVRRAGGMPLNSADGVVVAATDEAGENGPSSLVVDLDASGYPAGSILRVFPARSEDAAWVVVEGKHGPGNRITVP